MMKMREETGKIRMKIRSRKIKEGEDQESTVEGNSRSNYEDGEENKKMQQEKKHKKTNA